MGSREEDIPNAPTQKTTFIEDMTEEQTNAAVSFPLDYYLLIAKSNKTLLALWVTVKFVPPHCFWLM